MKPTLTDVLNMNWGGSGYPEYAGECKSGEGAAEKQARLNEAADRGKRDAENAKMSGDIADVEGGAIEGTPMYKRLVTSGIDSTSKAYDDVRVKRMAAANRAGFGYTQPATIGDQSSIDALEAHDIGEIPMTAANDVQAARFQAAGLRSGASGMYSGAQQGDQSTWATAEEKRKARMMQMWTGLAKMGVDAATSFIPKPK